MAEFRSKVHISEVETKPYEATFLHITSTADVIICVAHLV